MKIALKASNGQYVCAENGGGREVVANRGAIGPWEMFTVTDRGNGTVSLQAVNGQYLCAENGGGTSLVANRGAFGPWETFRLIDRGNGTIALQACNGQYVCAEMGGGTSVVVNRNAIGAWETFQRVALSTAWMEAAYDQIKDKTLAQLCLPGTHDSGTYQLFDELAPDAEDVIKELWNKARLGGATGVGDYIKSMAVTQTKSVYDQLQAGIRYIDLRVCYINGQFYTCHSLRGNPLSTLMQDVKRFLDENPKEVVVFKAGFKNMDNAQTQSAWNQISGGVGRYYYKPQSTSELLQKRFSELVDATAPKRAIFLIDNTDIYGIFDSGKTTNSGVVENLKSQTASFGGGRLLEAQCARPISTKDYVLGYVQKNGCRILPALPLLGGLPVVGGLLAAVGIVAVPAYLLYVRNFDPKATDLKQNARDSRSIVKDYFTWLAANPSKKPQLLICDFFEEVPLVNIAIRISTGQPFQDLLNGISNISPTPPAADRMVFFECSASAIAAAFKLAGYACNVAGDFIKNNVPGVTGTVLAGALKGAGYGLNEVGGFVQSAYGLSASALNDVLRGAGYAAGEVEGFFNTLGGQFKDFFDDAEEVMNPSKW